MALEDFLRRLRQSTGSRSGGGSAANRPVPLRYPPGHFYSPLPSDDEVAEAYTRGGFGPPFGGIDLNEAGQVALLDEIARYYPEHPFTEDPAAGHRYHLNNPSYGHF